MTLLALGRGTHNDARGARAKSATRVGMELPGLGEHCEHAGTSPTSDALRNRFPSARSEISRPNVSLADGLPTSPTRRVRPAGLPAVPVPRVRQDVLLGAQGIARLRRAGQTGAFPSLFRRRIPKPTRGRTRPDERELLCFFVDASRLLFSPRIASDLPGSERAPNSERVAPNQNPHTRRTRRAWCVLCAV